MKLKTTMKNLIAFAILLVISVSACSSRGPSSDSPAVVGSGVIEMSPAEARPHVEAAYSQLIDVRTRDEYLAGHASRARNIPLDELTENLDKIRQNDPVYLICQTGSRSRKAAQILADAGFPQVITISGGTAAWQDARFPMENVSR